LTIDDQKKQTKKNMKLKDLKLEKWTILLGEQNIKKKLGRIISFQPAVRASSCCEGALLI